MSKKFFIGFGFGALSVIVILIVIGGYVIFGRLPFLFQDPVATRHWGSQKNLDEYLENETKKIDEAMKRIRADQGDLMADYHYIASSKLVGLEDHELVRVRLTKLLQDPNRDIARAAISSLSFYMTGPLLDLIKAGASSPELYDSTVESLSFNPNSEAQDYKLYRKRENLEEILSNEKLDKKSRQLLKEAISRWK